MTLEWTDALVIGVSQIDREHRVLFDLVNDAIQLLAEGDGDPIAVGILTNILDRIDDHFIHEELIMDRFGYPFVGKHRDAHRELSRLITTMVRDTTGRAAQAAVLTLIASGLDDHMRGYDGLFSTYLKDNGCFGVI